MSVKHKEQKECDSEQQVNNRVGNHSQVTYAHTVICPMCNEETKMDTPSVKLAVCENGECPVTAWLVDE